MNGTQHPVLNLEPGTYTFDQSDPTNGATPPYQPHPLRFYTNNTSSGTTNEYTTDVTTNGTPGSSGAYTRIVITSSTTTPIYYGCFNHVGMGSEINVVSSSGNITIASDWTAAGRTCANLGTVSTVDITGGNIDGVTIGSNTAAAGTFTSLNVLDGNITNVGDISLDSISADSSSFSFGSDWTAAGRTCANLGIVTTADINGGNIDDVVIGSNTAAAGTFTSLNIDNLSIDGNIISSTSGDINITPHGTGKIDAGTADIDSSGIIGNSNATLLGTISASTPLQPNIISVGTLASLDISGDLSVDTDVLKVDTTNNRVGINKTSPAEALDIVGNVNISGNSKNRFSRR